MKPSLIAALFLLPALTLSGLDKAQETEVLNLYRAEMLAYHSEASILSLQATAEPASLRKAILLHNLSLISAPKGITGNAPQAVALFRTLAKEGPNEATSLVIQSYLGSSLALQAQEDWNPFAKISGVNDAYAVLDDLVRRYGQATFLPRFLRSQVSRAVPDFFGKKALYREDLEAIEKLSRTVPGYGVPSEVLSDVYDQLGTLAKESGKVSEAVAHWKKAVALDPQGQFGGKPAAKALAIFED